MPDSPPAAENSHGSSPLRHRPCDFCNQSTALLYCRADNAKLCLSCDREVHSTNQLFTKHTRSLLCDGCDSSPASIFCSTDGVVHCQNCDWETHNKNKANCGSPGTHDRRPLEAFAGCPSVSDLLSILGFEDLSKKGLLLCGEEGSDLLGSGDRFPDYFVWDTPSFVSLDDLIVSSGSEHNYQAMGVPPLPKNRNAAFGAYKDELLHQLRELAKSEPNADGSIIKPPINLSLPTQNNPNKSLGGFEHKLEYCALEQANTFEWCPDDQELIGVHGQCIVPDEKFVQSNHNNINTQQEQEQEQAQAFPFVVGLREINSQERETALSRYKQKKKSRRYDKHIRYESRKVRAESRTRIRGRFAKMERQNIASV